VRKQVFSWVVLLAVAGCSSQPSAKSPSTANSLADASPVAGPFNSQELQQFAALDPIDTHTHVMQVAPVFQNLLQRLNIHILDILVTHTPSQKDLDTESTQAWNFVKSSKGSATLCTTFNPFVYRAPNFSKTVITHINQDFAQGAVAVKIWKNIGEQVKDAKGNYVLPDDPVFAPIYKDIAGQNKTLIAHVADPNTIWEPPTPNAPDYSYYTEHPEWYMYNRPNAPSKPVILKARDHLLEMNPKLRVVGAHLGSMEADFNQIGDRLDRYPNFAVDLAARMPYVMMKSRPEIIAFIEKYQDRLIYATDNEFYADAKADDAVREWENTYALHWRFFATNDTLEEHGHKVQGLALPAPILKKLYHDNAVKWFPGIIASSH
jgi:predicted TIM-barrel fold metal-dependent hydrolase